MTNIPAKSFIGTVPILFAVFMPTAVNMPKACAQSNKNPCGCSNYEALTGYQSCLKRAETNRQGKLDYANARYSNCSNPTTATIEKYRDMLNSPTCNAGCRANARIKIGQYQDKLTGCDPQKQEIIREAQIDYQNTISNCCEDVNRNGLCVQSY